MFIISQKSSWKKISTLKEKIEYYRAVIFLLPSICYFSWYYAQPSRAPWALKLSEIRGDHAAQIFSHEEYDIFDFSLLILGASWGNISVFANVSCTLLTHYWAVHGAAEFPIHGLFHTSCMFVLRSLCASAWGFAQLSVCISPAEH